MRLVTYNIHYWAGLDGRLNLDAVARVVEESQADVVGLNEVLHPLYTPRGPRYPLVELAERLGYYWAFGPSFEQGAFRFWPGVLGNAVLSRYPIRKTLNIPLPSLPLRKQRTLFRASLDVHGATVIVLVSHLDHLLAMARRRQFQTIVHTMRHIRTPHILMGDFNTHTPVQSRIWKGERIIRLLRELGYEDAFARVGQGTGCSYPTRFPVARLDYIWVPRAWAWALTEARVLDSPLTRQASDHLPVCAHWQVEHALQAVDLDHSRWRELAPKHHEANPSPVAPLP